MNYLQALKSNIDENYFPIVPKKLPSQPFPEPMLVGEKGTAEYSSAQVGDAFVALFFALVRNIPEKRLLFLFKECLRQAYSCPEDAGNQVADLFLLAFQTRDCRGGKGERQLFYKLLIYLYGNYSATVLAVLPLVGEYGYYKDYFNILKEIGTASKYAALKDRILDLVANQLIADEANLEKSREGSAAKAQVSLCAKYAPREGNKFQEQHKEIFRELLQRLFPQLTAPAEATVEEQKAIYQRAKKQYRLLISKLTAALDVPEVKMCGKRFAEIDFDHVPSVCLKKYRKAFANEALRTPLKPNTEEAETGNRHPSDVDRIACRQHLLAAIKAQKIKGKQNYPHEITKLCMHGRTSQRSTTELELFQAQWNEIRRDILQQIAATKSNNSSNSNTKGVDLGKLVPMVDVSGSMSGTPMEVAIALGILISEVNHRAFRDRFLTFETTPHWVDLSHCSSIAEKVAVTQRASWGGTTNIEAAFDLIASAIEQHQLQEEEIPALIIFSDMQFDVAIRCGRQGGAMTQLQRIEERFAQLGEKLYGRPLARPTIIFWNLRGDTSGFPATAATANVQMLSGFSPALFKHVVDGSELSEKEKPNSYEIFRKAMDNERYDPVRAILSASQEGVLASFHPMI